MDYDIEIVSDSDSEHDLSSVPVINQADILPTITKPPLPPNISSRVSPFSSETFFNNNTARQLIRYEILNVNDQKYNNSKNVEVLIDKSNNEIIEIDSDDIAKNHSLEESSNCIVIDDDIIEDRKIETESSIHLKKGDKLICLNKKSNFYTPPNCTDSFYKLEKVLQIILKPEKLIHFFKCSASCCSFTTNRFSKFTTHVSTHRFPLNCLYCGKRNILCDHIINRHASRIFQCGLCLYRCCSKSQMTIHFSLCHKDKELNFHDCVNSMKFNIKKKDFSSFKRDFNCGFNKCLYSTSNIERLYNHFIFDHKKCHYACQYCTYESGNLSTFIYHLHLHEIAPFQCSFCKYGTFRFDKLFAHQSNYHLDFEFAYFYQNLRDTYLINGKNLKPRLRILDPKYHNFLALRKLCHKRYKRNRTALCLRESDRKPWKNIAKCCFCPFTFSQFSIFHRHWEKDHSHEGSKCIFHMDLPKQNFHQWDVNSRFDREDAGQNEKTAVLRATSPFSNSLSRSSRVVASIFDQKEVVTKKENARQAADVSRFSSRSSSASAMAASPECLMSEECDSLAPQPSSSFSLVSAPSTSTAPAPESSAEFFTKKGKLLKCQACGGEYKTLHGLKIHWKSKHKKLRLSLKTAVEVSQAEEVAKSSTVDAIKGPGPAERQPPAGSVTAKLSFSEVQNEVTSSSPNLDKESIYFCSYCHFKNQSATVMTKHWGECHFDQPFRCTWAKKSS